MPSTLDDAPDTGADDRFRSFLADGEFRLPHCVACDRSHFYPRVHCPFCGSDDLVWRLASGAGTVYSTTVVRRRDEAHNVALVDLDEGPRLMSRVEGVAPEQVGIGMAVRARVSGSGHEALLVFVPEVAR